MVVSRSIVHDRETVRATLACSRLTLGPGVFCSTPASKSRTDSVFYIPILWSEKARPSLQQVAVSAPAWRSATVAFFRALLSRTSSTVLLLLLVASALDMLQALPDGTFGKSYSRFMKGNKFSPDSRSAVQYVDDPDLAYVMRRRVKTGLRMSVAKAKSNMKILTFEATPEVPCCGCELSAVCVGKVRL